MDAVTASSQQSPTRKGSNHEPQTVKDPVCGMNVDPAKSPDRANYEGHDYHFCGTKCLTKFVADPAKYVSSRPSPVVGEEPGMIWTCPMHPQIREPRSGNCPLCGMALEAEAPSLDDKPNPELVDFTRRWWMSAVSMKSAPWPALPDMMMPAQ